MNTKMKIAGLAAPVLAMVVLGRLPAQAQSYQPYDGPVYQDYPSSYSTQPVQTYGQTYDRGYDQGYPDQAYDQGYRQGGYYDQGYDRGYQTRPASNNDGWVGLAVGAVAGALIVGALSDNDHDRGHRYRDRGHRRDDYRGHRGRRW